MIRSLYVRIILIFVGIVAASVVLSFSIASIVFRNEVNGLVTENLIANGEKIIRAYQSTPAAQLQPFMQNVSGMSDTYIQIYDQTGSPILHDDKFPLTVDPASVQRVLAGSVLRDVDLQGKDHHSLTGLPLQDNGQPYALFLTLDSESFDRLFSRIIQVVILSAIVVGSLLVLVAARFIVRPILALTRATKRMAQGKFDVRLRTGRKDEIGQLTDSFHRMAVELENLDRMRQAFVSNVSHEFQTPLTSISGFTKALKHKALSEERKQHYLSIIEDESERLSRLSRNLLQLSHLQHEDAPIEPRAYRLDEQLRKATITLEPQWADKGISLEVEFEPILVEADEDRLNQVWINLLGNSIKFTPAGGKIQVAAAIHRQHAVVTVSDNGPGIPAEARSDVFLPFHKVDSSRDSAIKGNGLGLSIAKQIVDLHHGEIQASESAMGGAAFTVRIPLRYEKAAR